MFRDSDPWDNNFEFQWFNLFFTVNLLIQIVNIILNFRKKEVPLEGSY